ncbi:phenylalanine--tRNA ligase subunit beta [Acidihalobacter yilgarnensis]|uniref:Phenylalanine--tRNA ligase beta subunit n=1 Tax=Acidihalobacter yilgarnensis TaxID=2819280 RepID=A0A1D8IMZ5_9GAMM|nr:phenylalanine--tRNA ligase subunit beta [Acidihalobacter yilgarnensis]AOU97848.1 phenylalanine--tRNA ligase subunit beta [Acidihalobacter yilgarnensis]
MRLSEHWLKEWLPDLAEDAETLGRRLTMAGLELDGIEPAAPPFSGIVVAQVRSVEPHPDADRLRICQVDAGDGQTVQVVCGAPNVLAGMYVPFARVGAVLPGDLRIKAAKLRGVESQGMLCSAAELGLAETSDGLMSLPKDFVLGQDLREALNLNDSVLEIDLTPNRADCLSVLGIARELSALESTPLRPMDFIEVAAQNDAVLHVRLDVPEACPRYVGRVIRGVDASAQAPLWLRERLRRSGVRSISSVVDVTNYVMLELGQPMHAFDLSRLSGDIRVRMARSGERIDLLNDQAVELRDDTLVIADDAGALAVAGIMGGSSSAVVGTTQDVFLESAYFSPDAVTGRARALGLHTESSHRFERGVDPALQRTAMERATALIIEIGGGAPGPLTEVCSEAHLPVRVPINLRRARIERLLGVRYEDAQIAGMLTALGCVLNETAEGWCVVPPSHRFDLSIEVDLIEELVRVHGYDRIPERHMPVRPGIVVEPEAAVSVHRLRELLCGRGYREAIAYSFIEASLAKRFAPDATPIVLSNPLSAELAVMRPSLWPGLVKALAYNANRQQSRGRLFETGLRFSSESLDNEQESMISGAAYGPVEPLQWGQGSREIDFFDIKGDVEALLALAGRAEEVVFVADRHPALHPGQSARIERGGEVIGWMGMLSPDLEKALGLERPIGLFELRLTPLCQGKLARFTPLSRFPATRRDLAVLVDDSVPAEALMATIRGLAIDELQELQLFDVYTGEGVPSGRKSIAFGLILQGLTSSLTDQMIEAIISRVVKELEGRLGAIPRG